MHIPSGDNLGDNVRIFEHILFRHYSSPSDFYLDDGLIWNLTYLAPKFITQLENRKNAY